jgi:curved DNA-binding protein
MCFHFSSLFFSKVSCAGMLMQVNLAREDVTTHGYVQRIQKEGMPVYDSDDQFGDLYITYIIKFPSSLTAEQKDAVRKLFS